MKKFVFSLESVLGMRDWEEQVCRQEFNAISIEVTLLEEKILKMESETTGAFERWNVMHAETFTRNERIGLMGSVDSMRRLESEAKTSLEAVNEKREQAMAKLTEAVRNKKVVENLKQQRLEAHQAESVLQEAREIEDIYNARRKGRGDS